MNNQMLNFAQQLVKTNQNNIPNAPWKEAAINAILCSESKLLLYTSAVCSVCRSFLRWLLLNKSI